MRIFIGLMLFVLISGCVTPAEQIAQQQREVDRMMQIYGPACDKMGFTNASDGWRNCVLQLDAKDRASQATNLSCIGGRGFVNCTSM